MARRCGKDWWGGGREREGLNNNGRGKGAD